MKVTSERLTDIRLFGDSPSLLIADDHVTACIKFVCFLSGKSHVTYNIKNITSIICDTNYSLKNLTRGKLPPTLDPLLFHLRRANCQCLEKCWYPHFGTSRSCWEWMGEEQRNTGARKNSSNCSTRSHC